MSGDRASRGRRRNPAGYSLVEVAVSIVVVGTMLAAALQAVGAARVGLRALGDRGRGLLLAQDLMAEILQQRYADADYGPGSFGLAATEAAPGTRSLFDDVDDYHGWAASPPQHKDGTPIEWAAGYRRSVAVAWVDPADWSQVAGSNTGVKRITVVVERDGRPVATLTALRTCGWPVPPAIAEVAGSLPVETPEPVE